MRDFPGFNIAAVPIDANINAAFFRVAASLKPFTNGYCLSPDEALPHVTLCQFRAQNEQTARALVENFLSKEVLVKNSGFYIRKDLPGLIDSTFWNMYVVCRDASLLTMQAQLYAHLHAASLEIRTKTGDQYFPHFTLGRTSQPPPSLDPSLVYAKELVDQEILCRVKLGRAGELGQFIQTLDGP